MATTTTKILVFVIGLVFTITGGRSWGVGCMLKSLGVIPAQPSKGSQP